MPNLIENAADSAGRPDANFLEFDRLPDSAIVRVPTVLRLRQLSRSGLYAAIADGRFPKPRKIFEGGRAVGWGAGELRDFLAKQPDA